MTSLSLECIRPKPISNDHEGPIIKTYIWFCKMSYESNLIVLNGCVGRYDYLMTCFDVICKWNYSEIEYIVCTDLFTNMTIMHLCH